MEYCIVNAEGVIENIIVSDSDFAAEIGAQPSYEGAAIGTDYDPPPSPTAMDRLEAQVAYTAMMTDTLLTEG